MSQAVKIREYVASRRDDFLEVLGRLVDLESHTYGERDVKDRCAAYLKRLFEGAGATMREIDKGEVGTHLVGSVGSGPRKILLVGHYDTVFPTGTTKDRPFTVRDGRAYGPGVFDMKGGLASYWMAITALRDLGIFPDDRSVELFFNCDEEAGSGTSRAIVEEMARDCAACLVAEPGHSGEGYATIERFGRSVVKITANGVAGHAGNRPDYSANPLLELAAVMQHLEAKSDKSRGIWYSPVSLHAGDAGPTAMTPETAYAWFDIRYADESLGREVDEELRALRPSSESVSFEITGGVEKPPFGPTEANARVRERAKEIVEEMGHTFAPKRLGGGSDGNFTSAVGCGTLDGLGLNGAFLHNPKEYIEIDTIPSRVALVAELIRTL